MKDLYVGDFVPEDDGMNSEGGILGNEGKQEDDTMSRLLLALCIFGVIFYLYTQVV